MAEATLWDSKVESQEASHLPQALLEYFFGIPGPPRGEPDSPETPMLERPQEDTPVGSDSQAHPSRHVYKFQDMYMKSL